MSSVVTSLLRVTFLKRTKMSKRALTYLKINKLAILIKKPTKSGHLFARNRLKEPRKHTDRQHQLTSRTYRALCFRPQTCSRCLHTCPVSRISLSCRARGTRWHRPVEIPCQDPRSAAPQTLCPLSRYISRSVGTLSCSSDKF